MRLQTLALWCAARAVSGVLEGGAIGVCCCAREVLPVRELPVDWLRRPAVQTFAGGSVPVRLAAGGGDSAG